MASIWQPLKKAYAFECKETKTLRIFNQIRKAVLKTGNLKEYFKYAIGEIFLVVLGILIALQINNLNEERKTNSNRVLVLEILRESFLENETAISTTLKKHQANLKVTELRIKNTGPRVKLPEQSIIDSIRLVDLANLKLANDLKSTILIDNSSLSLLGSDIRKSLLEFSTAYQEYKIIEGNIDNLVFKLRENHQKHISLLTENTSNNTSLRSNYNMFNSDYKNWLRDPANQNISVEIKWKIELAISALKMLNQKNQAIIQYVNKTLNINEDQ